MQESPVVINSSHHDQGIEIRVKSAKLNTVLDLIYPEGIWQNYPDANKDKLLDNVAYIFTAHLPFLLRGNTKLDYNTGYPSIFSWANQCFMRFLPAYWFLYQKKWGRGVFPMLKTILNSRAYFSPIRDIPPEFPETLQDNVVLPFTFGKDSFLSYYLCQQLGLKPLLVYFNEPTEAYAKSHKLSLIKKFTQLTGEKVVFMDNPLGNLRDFGEGWFGWELALTSWTLMGLPFAYSHQAAYILFSNEKSTNAFFYDRQGFKVVPDYEQSAQATEELSLIAQSLTEGEVFVTTFLQGVNELAIVALLRDMAPSTFQFLMSCWAETEAAAHQRWCADCSKCARLYIYMTACGIDPIKQAGFTQSMLSADKMRLFNVFGSSASGTGWDAFGLNTDEQALAFYLTYLRGNREPLIEQFRASAEYEKVSQNFKAMVKEYLGLHPENSTPPQWKQQLDGLLRSKLEAIQNEAKHLQFQSQKTTA